MRVLITASGIQDYIFDITQKAASARLRGRSARLGLVLDRCYQRISEKLGKPPKIHRNAGSRLEVEIDATPDATTALVKELQADLDRHSRENLDGQVWFTAVAGTSNPEAYERLREQKLNPGKGVLQQNNNTWNQDAFIIQRQTDERQVQRVDREEARNLPEAILGRSLAHRENEFFQFTQGDPSKRAIILDRSVEVSRSDPGGFRFTLKPNNAKADSHLINKRLCRYAPINAENRFELLDFNEIAKKSAGAHFLGVLKADLDNAGKVFNDLRSESEKQILSERLDTFFTTGIEALLEEKYRDCYVVFSGGDDLFLIGPWNQLLRFALALRGKLQQEASGWGVGRLTLSAGFKLTHPGSAVRHFAADVETALDLAKDRRPSGSRLPAKNRIAVFERILAWEEANDGINWAEEFIRAAGAQPPELPRGFLQRMQYYAGESRHFFEDRQIDGLRMIPLLQNDWSRNSDRIAKDLRERIEKDVLPLLKQLDERGERMWRVMDFASRFASYALR